MQKWFTNIDDFEKDVLRRTIFGFYDSGELATAKNLAFKLRNKINCRGSVSSMYKILKSTGFKYRKLNDGRKFLM
jgi:transposase